MSGIKADGIVLVELVIVVVELVVAVLVELVARSEADTTLHRT